MGEHRHHHHRHHHNPGHANIMAQIMPILQTLAKRSYRKNTNLSASSDSKVEASSKSRAYVVSKWKTHINEMFVNKQNNNASKVLTRSEDQSGETDAVIDFNADVDVMKDSVLNAKSSVESEPQKVTTPGCAVGSPAGRSAVPTAGSQKSVKEAVDKVFKPQKEGSGGQHNPNSPTGKNELVMAWNDLTLVQKNLLGKPVKNILDSLNGQINFHSLTALMGPSGAGKTSLLKCVNMRSNAGLTADTQMFVSKYTELRTAFIMQSADEHIINGLTVRESLLFASKLKNKKSVGLKGRDNIAAETGDSASLEPGLGRKHQVIDETVPLDIDGNFDHDMNVRRILLDLLLADCADNAVQTCSGGEQKRLTIGLELVQQNKPNLMCIDEPTSGLDSNASEMVIQCLKELSERHRMAIVTSIHQPNSLLLSMFTQLYVLSKGGHCVFAGRPNLLKDHLNSCGVTCPEDVQPIELLLKIATNFPNDKFQSAVRNQSLNIELRYDWITTLGFGIFLTSLGVILCYLYGWDIGETDGCLDLM
ncbi:unnamed protein product, partial [Medioppia subpectinata]